MKHRRVITFTKKSGIGLALVLGLALVGCGSNAEPPTEHARHEHAEADAHDHDEHASEDQYEISLPSASLASLNLEMIEVQRRPVGGTQEFPGRVVPVPDQEAMVTSLVAGRIERVFVNDGDRVQQGEPVALVTGPQLGDLIAELRHTHADFQRQQRLSERGVGVRKRLIEAETAYGAARQHLRATGFSTDEIATLAADNEDIGGMPLRAPIGGIVLERSATQGGPVEAGDVLFRIAEFSPIWVEADVYERDLERVREGMKVYVTAHTGDGMTYPGTIRQVLPQIDRERRVATLRISLPNDDERLKPGMFATVNVLAAGEEQSALPVSALMTDGKRSYVIVAENDSTFRRIDVGAPADGTGYVAVPELPVGTRVVTTGAFQIHSAMTGVEAGHSH